VNLLDVNAWIALTVEAHQHHSVAMEVRGSLLQSGAAFCRVSQLSYLRLLNNPHVMGDQVMSQAGAWAYYDRLLGVSGITFLSEPEDLEVHLRGLTHTERVSPNAWPDAYLGAFAAAGGHRVVTFDRDFSQWPELDVLLLKP
jgi:toxin-antitoxin system PIN domain toxin